MGQYYKAIILGEKKISKHEVIRISMHTIGSKLMEHSYIDNHFVQLFEYLLTPEGIFYKSRVVWAGDYADEEEGLDQNLYCISDNYPDKNLNNTTKLIPKEYKYISNHTKKIYVNKDKHTYIHPLPILTAEGNGRGGGDYYGKHNELVGTWARDVISIEKDIPENYTEFDCNFSRI